MTHWIADHLRWLAEHADKVGDTLDHWKEQAFHLEIEVGELRHESDNTCPRCGYKSLKLLVGASGIEPETPTMSRSEQGNENKDLTQDGDDG